MIHLKKTRLADRGISFFFFFFFTIFQIMPTMTLASCLPAEALHVLGCQFSQSPSKGYVNRSAYLRKQILVSSKAPMMSTSSQVSPKLKSKLKIHDQKSRKSKKKNLKITK